MADLRLHPDRLLPAEPGVRDIARRLYDAVRDLPIISPHGHVDPRLLLDDPPFADPTSLFIQPDHYVTRLLHAGGDRPGPARRGGGPAARGPGPRGVAAALRQLAPAAGHPGAVLVRQRTRRDLRGHRAAERRQRRRAVRPDQPSSWRQPSHRPRALLRRFGIEFLATTDDPADDLAAHAALARRPGDRHDRVAPTFRPDRYLEAGRTGWADAVKGLGEAADTDVGDYAGYIAALERAPAVLHRARCGVGRPQPRRRGRRAARAAARPTGSTGAALAGAGLRRRRPPRSGGT